MWPNLSTQNAARSLRTALGYSANNLMLGHYVSYVGEYTNDTKEEEKQEKNQLLLQGQKEYDQKSIKRWLTGLPPRPK